jgi:hypothetical protein
MSTTDQFWQYAEEAMLGARHSKNETEKRALLDLARSWTQAALQSESTPFIIASVEATNAAKLALAKRAVAQSQIAFPSSGARLCPHIASTN